MSNITEGLRPLTHPVGELVLHPRNYRQGDVESIAESLTRFGQVRPIVVQKSSMSVVAGNHTLKAALSLGWDTVAAVLVDLSDEEAEAYLVADNRLSDKATNDDAILAPILERLMLAGRLDGTGYSPDDVDDMLSTMDQLPEVDAAEFEGGNAVTDDQLAERFANRSQVALRQFVLMYEQDTASEVERMFRQLERAWGMSGARDVVLEALRRTVGSLEGTEAADATAVAAEEAVAAPPEAPAEQPGDAARIPAAPAVTNEEAATNVNAAAEPEAATAAAGSTEGELATTEGAVGETGVEPQAPEQALAEADDRAAAAAEPEWCTCGAKTPQAQYHSAGCPARAELDGVTGAAGAPPVPADLDAGVPAEPADESIAESLGTPPVPSAYDTGA